MRLAFVAVVLLLSRGSATAQILISSAGNAAVGTSEYIVYSIGEMVTETCNSSTNTLTYGFNQPVPGTIGVLENESLEVSVFPNPTTALVVVKCTSGSSVEIYDAAARMVFSSEMTSDQETFDLTSLRAGIHTMVVRMDQKSSTLKLIKN